MYATQNAPSPTTPTTTLRGAGHGGVGKHRRPASRAGIALLIAAAAAAAGLVLTPVASADPGQGGVTGGTAGQGGVTGGNSGQGGVTGGGAPAPAPTPAPAPEPEPEPARTYWAAPPAHYDQVQWQQWDGPTSQGTSDYSDYSYDNDTSENTYTEPSAPLNVSELHGPVAVAPSAPIATPKKIVRWGKYYDDQPNWMSDNVAERTNNSTSVIEAQVTDGWRSIGVPTDRAQRLAGSQLALGAAGLVTGATTAGTAGAVVGALGGGTIGGIIGAGLGGLVPIAPGIAPITTGVAGTAIGAGVGAAAVGIPSAAVGGVAGLASGIAVGTTYGAGDLTEPQKVEIPELDPPVITDQTQQVIDAVDTLPGGSDAVQAWTAPPTPADDARAFTLTQPGGDQVIAGLDKAASDIATSDLAPAVQVIGDAIGAALRPAGAPA